jgi:hypothetical protein
MKYDAENYKRDFETYDPLQKIFLEKFLENKRSKEQYAFMNWPVQNREKGEQFFEVGSEYFRAALVLMDIVLQDKTDCKGDYLVFPIIYSIFHGIELCLKGMYYAMREYAGHYNLKFDEKPIWKWHDLKELQNIVITESTRLSLPTFKQDFQILGFFVAELLPDTAEPTYPRYPYFDRNLCEQFFLKEAKHYIIDMIVLLKQTGAVYFILERNFIKSDEEIQARNYAFD